MIIISRKFLTLAAALALTLSSRAAPETIIWFDTPATNFTSSSPLGNGRLGAMMFGGVDQERIVLNESSVWSGSRQDADRPDAAKALPEIRRLLLEGKNNEAEALVNANFTCKGPGSGGGQYGCYQVLGNLHLSFPAADSNTTVTGYRRELDLSTATARVQFTRGGVTFQREMFASAPDEVMVLRLTAGRPGRISLQATLDRPERSTTRASAAEGLLMTGQLDNGVDGKGVKFAARVRILNHGGKVEIDGDAMRVINADEVILFITAATDYQGFAGRQTTNAETASWDDSKAAMRKSCEVLRKAHVADYQKYFQRVKLDLDAGREQASALPITARVKAFQAGADDPGLAALYFNSDATCSSPHRAPAVSPPISREFGPRNCARRGRAIGTSMSTCK